MRSKGFYVNERKSKGVDSIQVSHDPAQRSTLTNMVMTIELGIPF